MYWLLAAGAKVRHGAHHFSIKNLRERLDWLVAVGYETFGTRRSLINTSLCPSTRHFVQFCSLFFLYSVLLQWLM